MPDMIDFYLADRVEHQNKGRVFCSRQYQRAGDFASGVARGAANRVKRTEYSVPGSGLIRKMKHPFDLQ